METEITAPIAGKVAKINVSAGDAVRQGQVLVEFE
jgi:methylmalonyl-CoA carboxyltransferase small subunit